MLHMSVLMYVDNGAVIFEKESDLVKCIENDR